MGSCLCGGVPRVRVDGQVCEFTAERQGVPEAARLAVREAPGRINSLEGQFTLASAPFALAWATDQPSAAMLAHMSVECAAFENGFILRGIEGYLYDVVLERANPG